MIDRKRATAIVILTAIDRAGIGLRTLGASLSLFAITVRDAVEDEARERGGHVEVAPLALCWLCREKPVASGARLYCDRCARVTVEALRQRSKGAAS